MADIDNFRQLLQYFVAHLEFCDANFINKPKWTKKERDKNISPRVITTRGFNNYLTIYIGKWKDFPFGGSKLQDQINKWANLSGGRKITIGINTTGPKKYRSESQFLNWNAEWFAIRAEWSGDSIESLVITKGDYKTKKDYKKLGSKLKVLDNLYDASGNIVSTNTPELIDFWTAFESLNPISSAPKPKTPDSPSHPLNLILYGPPGTGKTYNTLFHALAIIKNTDVKKLQKGVEDGTLKYDDLKKEYDTYVKSGQIDFTTFHQSMSYEDFIEGIKPIPPQNKEEQMVYDVQDGIFKEICEKAKKISVVNTSTKIDFSKTRVFKMSLGEKGKDADSVFEYCVENEVLALGWGDSIDFSTCKTRKEFKDKDSSWGAAALEIFKEWMKTGDIVLISDGTKEVKGIAQVAGDYEFRDDPSIDMHQFRKAKWLYTGNNIPISKIYDKNLSQQSIYGFYKEKKGVVDNGGIKIDVLNEIITGEINDKKEENYVLIIDEINRGNVAQIFGELITLIEPSKRLGNSEEMKAILPYSSAQKGEPVYFGVPNNLYIIGTMNTADRSVEALDTALRRRFSFEEMMPKPKLLGDKELCDVKLSDLLTTINQRIVALKDREHQIGHSYFMGHDDKNEDGSDKYPNKEEWLTNVFKDKIIPLLQEYFYGDYKKIYYVLGGSKTAGEGFVKIDSVTKSDIFAVKIEDDYYYDIPEMRYEIQTIDESFDINKAIGIMMKKEAPSEIIE